MKIEEYRKTIKKKHKYKAEAHSVDNIRFSSKKESNRYKELKLLEKVGLIKELMIQPKFPIFVNGIKICTYVGDFWYNDVKKGKFVLEDVKGLKLPIYNLKKKLVKAVLGIDIVEV